jgi:Transglutaminase-like superfamily
MKKATVVLIFLLLELTSSWSQSQDDLTSLSQKLTAHLTNDSLKVASLYFWITSNIRYDTRFRNREEGDTTLTQEPYNVIKTKKAICIGYAKLFRELCKMSNIKAYVIEGIVKDKNGFLEREGHAWNVVQIHENYYLLDATWGAGDAALAQNYFLTTPSVFLQNHLPDDPIWQLQTQLIDYDCFTKNNNCNKHSEYFNFKDSIQSWEGMDSLNKVFNSANRTLNYNTEDIQAMRAMAGFYSEKALKGIAEYNKLRIEIKEKKRKPTLRTQVLKLLDDTKKQAETAKSFYERIAISTKKYPYTDAHLNLDLIRENLLSLEKERHFVETYFKD